ncbi:hypothetical protein [Streptomyces sp. SID13031]|uniref:hypothetical protein n=1 Tax=Streptomyces sp. SID13031 TaxID=2706046 RepID=UPI0013C7573E|nr:hypothetical protein [Streptomyces sp. SID13031]NEA36998.1 hypothetical protein [Streptomyces sp. SID13031]
MSPSRTPQTASTTTRHAQPAEDPPSTEVQDTTYPASPPNLPPPAAGGVQVEGVTLSRNSTPALSLGMVGGIFLAAGGLLLAGAALLFRRRGKHSI